MTKMTKRIKKNKRKIARATIIGWADGSTEIYVIDKKEQECPERNV
ncbi:hypothetical protein [Streptococcus sp. S784/96/1]|nr:hypothetical protein [Streptococcus sp. S784/96/1]